MRHNEYTLISIINLLLKPKILDIGNINFFLLMIKTPILQYYNFKIITHTHL